MKKAAFLSRRTIVFFLLITIASFYTNAQTWNFMKFPTESEGATLYGATICTATEEVFTLEKNAVDYFTLVEYPNGNYLSNTTYFPSGTQYHGGPNGLASDNTNVFVGANITSNNSVVYLVNHLSGGSPPVPYIPITPAGASFTKITSVVRDDQYVYITGSINSFVFGGDAITFGGGFVASTTVNTAGLGDYGFVAKFSFNTLSFEWVKLITKSSISSRPKDLSVDDNGNVFVTGIINGLSPTTFFHSGGSTDYTANSTTQHDAYILKMNSAGVMDLTWGIKQYTSDHNAGADIKVDPTDDAVYFVSKKDEIRKHSTLGTGSLIWTKTIPDASITQIALNNCETMYATGSLYQASQNRYFSQSFNKVTTTDDWTSNTVSTTATNSPGSYGKALLIRKDDKVEVVGDYRDPGNGQYMTIDSETPSTVLSGIFIGRAEAACCPLPIYLKSIIICEEDRIPTISILPQLQAAGISVAGLTIVWKRDGVIIPGANSPSLQLSLSGIYTVEVLFPGCSTPVVASMNFVIKQCVYPPCVINPTFEFNTLDGCTYDFTNTTPAPLGINVTGWNWTVDGVVVSNTEDMSYTFMSSGTYEVCLTVYGENGNVGCYGTICKEVTVGRGCDPAPCIIKSSFDIAAIDPCTFIFTNTTPTPLGVNIMGWKWTVNGNLVSNTEDLTYSFSGGGIYEVCLTVYGENGIVGCFNTICKEIKVKGCFPGPCSVVSDFTSAQSITNPCTFQFTDLSTAAMGYNITDWQWKINGVVFSTDQNPTYTFPTGGTYNICLRSVGSNDNVACMNTICYDVKVKGCTNISPVRTESPLNVWPNPSNGEYNVNISPQNFNKAQVKIYNTVGNEVSFEIGERNEIPFIKLDDNLEKGIYFLQIVSEGKQMKSKLIKY